MAGGMGLIALAGTAAGAGFGAAKVGEEWLKDTFEKEKQAAIALREENLARINNEAADRRQAVSESGQDRRQAVSETGSDRRLNVTETGATNRQTAGLIHNENLQGQQFSHQEALQRAQQAFQAEEKKLDRTLTREQIASHERIGAANNATALAVAKVGGTVQQDKDGNILFLTKDGKASKIDDPNNPGKALTGFKDLTPAAKAYSDVIREQLKGLDREELSATTMGDKAQLEKITERRADLNGRLLNVLTGGISSTNKGAEKAPAAAQWDDKTGDVIVNGKKIGSAKTKDDAIKVARTAAQSAGGEGGESAPAAGEAKGSTPARQRAPAYEPPAGSVAADVASRRRGLIESRMNQERDTAEAASRIRDDFELDRRSLSAPQLAEKYADKFDSLTDAQRSVIFKSRNPQMAPHVSM